MIKILKLWNDDQLKTKLRSQWHCTSYHDWTLCLSIMLLSFTSAVLGCMSFECILAPCVTVVRADDRTWDKTQSVHIHSHGHNICKMWQPWSQYWGEAFLPIVGKQTVHGNVPKSNLIKCQTYCTTETSKSLIQSLQLSDITGLQCDVSLYLTLPSCSTIFSNSWCLSLRPPLTSIWSVMAADGERDREVWRGSWHRGKKCHPGRVVTGWSPWWSHWVVCRNKEGRSSSYCLCCQLIDGMVFEVSLRATPHSSLFCLLLLWHLPTSGWATEFQ